MDDEGQRVSAGDSDRQTYEADRTRRLQRGRLLGYALSVALWLFSAIPLARLSSDEGGGAGVTVVYLAAGLGIALVSRGIYIRLTRKPFWSPWLFVIAAVLAIVSYGIQSAGERVVGPRVDSIPLSTLRHA
jgi:hypothetical protein